MLGPQAGSCVRPICQLASLGWDAVSWVVLVNHCTALRSLAHAASCSHTSVLVVGPGVASYFVFCVNLVGAQLVPPGYWPFHIVTRVLRRSA